MAGHALSRALSVASPRHDLRRLGWTLAWAAALALALLFVQRNLVVSADLRLFMPAPETAQERLLLEGLASGPAARVVLVGLEGGDAAGRAAASRALVAAFRQAPGVLQAMNGEDAAGAAVPEALLPLRYLLADTSLDAAALHEALVTRQQDLASPLAALVEEWAPRDPGLLALQLAEAWTPATQPVLQDGVWASRDGQRAVLLVELDVRGFDPDAQATGMHALSAALAGTALPAGVRATFTGPAAFSALMRDRTEGEARWIGLVDTVGLLLLLFYAYRRWQWVLLGALPLATAGLAGLVAVALVYGEAHGITLAFGFTLIGVAQDYPLHLFSHQHPGTDPRAEARQLWPTLATGVASTCIAYLTFLASGVTGLAQLACFTVAGLAAAALTTRAWLPRLMAPAQADAATSPRLQRLWQRVSHWPRPHLSLWLLAAAATASLALSSTPRWQDSLAALTPVPAPLLAADRQLRTDLGAADVRYFVAIEADTAEAALQASERLWPTLEQWRGAGLVADYDLAARYLPSQQRQATRRARLPDDATLRRDLATAVQGTDFEAITFEPFLEDVAKARSQAPLDAATLAGTPLAARVESLLLPQGGKWTALVTLTQVGDAQALAARCAAAGVTLLDLKSASEGLMARQRTRVVELLGLAFLALLAVVWLALRDLRRVVRVVTPLALTTLLVVAVLQLAGVSLTLFHLVALVLAAGLGLDYALFFERPGTTPAEQVRTLHAVLACSATTLLVFALLACSSLPVLRAIGLTVTLGVVSNFILALLVSRAPPPAQSTPERPA